MSYPNDEVAPHAGAWIETYRHRDLIPPYWVAPHAGAWIETCRSGQGAARLPVAPHAGAWIETSCCIRLPVVYTGRPPRGGVD